jgi:hypothetical protein
LAQSTAGRLALVVALVTVALLLAWVETMQPMMRGARCAEFAADSLARQEDMPRPQGNCLT